MLHSGIRLKLDASIPRRPPFVSDSIFVTVKCSSEDMRLHAIILAGAGGR